MGMVCLLERQGVGRTARIGARRQHPAVGLAARDDGPDAAGADLGPGVPEGPRLGGRDLGNARLHGELAGPFGCPSSSTNLSLRVLAVQPSSGANADLRKTPPLGVRAIMLPCASMTAMCVVPSAASGTLVAAPTSRPAGGAAGSARSGAISFARPAR